MTFHAAKKEILQDIYRAKNIIQQIQQKYNQKKPQFRCKCGKLYIHRASLHNHQKVCEVENENLEKNIKKKKKKKKFFPKILKLSIQAIIIYYRPLCKRIMNFVKC